MKKIAIFFFIIIAIIAGISYTYLNYKANYHIAQRENLAFENYYEKEVLGVELTTLINKAVDTNNQNEIEKDTKGKYKENKTNSIQIDIKMKDNNKTYSMETLYYGGMDKFVQYYSQIKFKCIKLEYHSQTQKVRYMLFEQITE